MTDMKRITISLPDDLDAAVEALRKTERFARASYSEIIRHLVRELTPEAGALLNVTLLFSASSV